MRAQLFCACAIYAIVCHTRVEPLSRCARFAARACRKTVTNVKTVRTRKSFRESEQESTSDCQAAVALVVRKPLVTLVEVECLKRARRDAYLPAS